MFVPRRWLLLVLLIVRGWAAHCQMVDSTRLAPDWIAEGFVGAGNSIAVETVRTAPGTERTIDLGSWMQLGAAVEHRWKNRWSMRGMLAYELGQWQGGSGGGNIGAAPFVAGDRVALEAGVSWQFGGRDRIQFTYRGALRATAGMDVQVDTWTGTDFSTGDWEQAHFFYKPSLAPQLGMAFRVPLGLGPFGISGQADVFTFTHALQRVELSAGLRELPRTLKPLAGVHNGLGYAIKLAVFALF